MTPSSSPSVVLAVTPHGGRAVLLPGDVIGRSEAAALSIPHPGISEVHAYVSLRGGALTLLGLRGRLALDGRLVPRVDLAIGQAIQLARGVAVHVEDVVLPDTVLAIETEGLGRQLPTGTCALVFDPMPSLAPGHRPEAPLQLWTQDGTWFASTPEGAAQPVHDGVTWTIGDRTVHASFVPVAAAGTPPTRRDAGLGAPLTIVAKYDSVHITSGGRLLVTLNGRTAQLLSELAAVDAPVAWQEVAAEIWGREGSPISLRSRLDVTLNRLRKRLASVGVRTDLVRADGCGLLELVRAPDDRIELDL